MSSVFDDEGDEYGGDGGRERECLHDMPRGGDGVSLHDLQVGAEVGLNASVEDSKVEKADGAAAKYRTVCE